MFFLLIRIPKITTHYSTSLKSWDHWTQGISLFIEKLIHSAFVLWRLGVSSSHWCKLNTGPRLASKLVWRCHKLSLLIRHLKIFSKHRETFPPPKWEKSLQGSNSDFSSFCIPGCQRMHTTRSPSSIPTGVSGDALDLSLSGSQLSMSKRPSSASPGKYFSRSVSVSVASESRGKRNTLVRKYTSCYRPMFQNHCLVLLCQKVLVLS